MRIKRGKGEKKMEKPEMFCFKYNFKKSFAGFQNSQISFFDKFYIFGVILDNKSFSYMNGKAKSRYLVFGSLGDIENQMVRDFLKDVYNTFDSTDLSLYDEGNLTVDVPKDLVLVKNLYRLLIGLLQSKVDLARLNNFHLSLSYIMAYDVPLGFVEFNKESYYKFWEYFDETFQSDMISKENCFKVDNIKSYGCNCRVCGYYNEYAEIDNIEKDGKHTCWNCSNDYARVIRGLSGDIDNKVMMIRKNNNVR